MINNKFFNFCHYSRLVGFAFGELPSVGSSLRSSTFVFHQASCLMPHASCLTPHASRLTPRTLAVICYNKSFPVTSYLLNPIVISVKVLLKVCILLKIIRKMHDLCKTKMN
jgi:hypothetical protein